MLKSSLIFLWLFFTVIATALPLGNKERTSAAPCGVSKVPLKDAAERIIGGSDAKKGQYPWMVSLVYMGISHMCGATIIDDYWILSAATCFQNSQNGNLYTARAGSHFLKEFDRDVIDYQVEKIVLHPNWQPSRALNNIAMLKLKKPVNFTSLYINRVCLPTPNIDTDEKVGRIIGWGNTKPGSGFSLPSVLQNADITIKNPGDCYSAWGNMYDHATELCAKSETTAFCSGDGGGPIHVADASSGGAFVQVGIASFVSGSNCLYGGPNVFTRVSAYLDWIKQTIASG